LVPQTDHYLLGGETNKVEKAKLDEEDDSY